MANYKFRLESRVNLLNKEEARKSREIMLLENKIEQSRMKNNQRLELKDEKRRRDQARHMDIERQKELNMSRRYNHDDSMKFTQTTIFCNRRDIRNALKEIQKEGHDTIESVNCLYDQIKIKKKERVSTLKRNWSKNIERFWEARLNSIKEARALDSMVQQREMSRLRKQIRSLERREETLCNTLNEKVSTIYHYKHELC